MQQQPTSSTFAHVDRFANVLCNVAAPADAPVDTDSFAMPSKTPSVVISGAGIGGLVLALGLLKRGFKVQIVERDLTAIRGEGKYRGPIQVQSNALAALEAIDQNVAEKVMAAGCITGDRINGLCDGLTGDWYVKFDTFHPAVDRGLPVTRVISRFTLQEILADACRAIAGDDVIVNDVNIIDYEEKVDDMSGKKVVSAIADDGRRFQGDMLVGADGIWSKLRNKIVGESTATYSDYTCYTGISDYTPPDIDTVGYRVFLGNGQYFVSSDVGGGKTQWYGFHKEPAGGTDEPGKKKERLLEIFGNWSDLVTDLIRATPEDDVLRRDIYDRAPVFKWTQGRVVLLGDSVHAMQPNLGQGGCMAIEDAFQLVTDLTAAYESGGGDAASLNYEGIFRGYFGKRFVRASAIHGMARMAAIMASTYKAYLGEGLGPLGKILLPLRIPHPGRVSGQLILKLTMPSVLEWVLGGYENSLSASGRIPVCRLEDQPQGFSEKDFPLFMRDDDALLKAANAAWMLVPLVPLNTMSADELDEEGVVIREDVLTVGSDMSSGLYVPGSSAQHARVNRTAGGDHIVVDVGSEAGTYVNNKEIAPNEPYKLQPGDELVFGPMSPIYRVKMQHSSVVEGQHGMYDRRGKRKAGVAV